MHALPRSRLGFGFFASMSSSAARVGGGGGRDPSNNPAVGRLRELVQRGDAAGEDGSGSPPRSLCLSLVVVGWGLGGVGIEERGVSRFGSWYRMCGWWWVWADWIIELGASSWGNLFGLVLKRRKNEAVERDSSGDSLAALLKQHWLNSNYGCLIV